MLPGCLFLRGEQVASIGCFPGQDILIKALLMVNIIDAGLNPGDFPLQTVSLPGKDLLPPGDGGPALEAKLQVLPHLLDAHAAVFQAGEAADPGNVPVIEDPAVLAVPLDIGYQALVAVEFQGLIGQPGFFTGLLHGIRRHLSVSEYSRGTAGENDVALGNAPANRIFQQELFSILCISVSLSYLINWCLTGGRRAGS